MTDWQPIETAPKDGKLILLCEVDDEGPSDPKIGSWDGEGWKIYEPFEDHWNWTHWHPLPDPPA